MPVFTTSTFLLAGLARCLLHEGNLDRSNCEIDSLVLRATHKVHAGMIDLLISRELTIIVSRQDNSDICSTLTEKHWTIDSLYKDIISLKRKGSLIAYDVRGNVLLSGDAMNRFPLYYASHKQGLIAGFDPRSIGALSQASIDLSYFATRLTGLDTSYPFYEKTPWSGVRLLLSQNILRAEGSTGLLKHLRVWTPPCADETLSNIGPVLHDRVLQVIKTEVQKDVSSDLSGGLDSTSICYWSQELELNLHTVFLGSEASSDSDYQWSILAAKDLASNHMTLDYATATSLEKISGHTLLHRLPFGPSEAYRYSVLAPLLASLYQGTTVKCHMNGHGGDELFGPLSGMAWSLYRSSFSQSRRSLRGFAKINKFNIRDFYRSISSESSLIDDLTSLRFLEIKQIDDTDKFSSSWVPYPAVASFVSDFTKNLVLEACAHYVDIGVESFTTDRSQHQIIQQVHMHSMLEHDMNLMVRHSNFRFLGPLLDFEIIRLASSLNIEERFNASLVKPLLAAAKSKRMPIGFFERRDKGEYSRETYKEFNARKMCLQHLFASDCLLYDLGLVDPDALRSQVHQFSADGSSLEQLMQVEILELWLQAAVEEGAI